MLLLVSVELYLRTSNTADSNSPLPTSFDQTTKRGGHLSHPDFPRLLPLSHQGVKGVHSLANEETYGGLLAGSASCSSRERGEGGEEDC